MPTGPASATDTDTDSSISRASYAEPVALVALLSSTWLLVNFALSETSVAVASAGRTGFATIGLFAIATRQRRTRPAAVQAGLPALQVVVLAATGVALYTVCSTLAIELAGPTVPSLVLSVSPLVTLIVESIMYRTRPSVRTVAGLVVAVGGVVVLVSQRSSESGYSPWLGVVVAVVAMSSMIFYTIYFARLMADRGVATARVVFPIFMVGGIPLVMWAAADLVGGAPISWLAVGVLVVLGLGVYTPAYLLQHRILSRLGASFASAVGLAVPPVVLAGEVVFGMTDVPGAGQWLAALVTVAAVALSARGLRRTRAERSVSRS